VIIDIHVWGVKISDMSRAGQAQARQQRGITMRLGLCASALALTLVATPASATVYLVGINGGLTGTTLTTMCLPGPGCLPANAQQSSVFNGNFSTMLGPMNLVDGDNPFTSGSIYLGGLFSGIINNSGGVLSGHDLSFSLQTCSPGQPAVGCQVTNGSARLFAVSGGVPEPASWALMLIGFGAIGSAMRRRRPVPARVTFAA
jgi:hypothetical protein